MLSRLDTHKHLFRALLVNGICFGVPRKGHQACHLVTKMEKKITQSKGAGLAWDWLLLTPSHPVGSLHVAKPGLRHVLEEKATSCYPGTFGIHLQHLLPLLLSSSFLLFSQNRVSLYIPGGYSSHSFEIPGVRRHSTLSPSPNLSCSLSPWKSFIPAVQV